MSNPRYRSANNTKGRNKQKPDAVLEHAWKELTNLTQREARGRRRAPTTVPLTPTGRPRKRMNTQQREQRNTARARNKAERAAQSEHERRSKAAKKGWDKIPPAERTRRAEKGWETRDRMRGQYSPEPRRQKRARARPISMPF